MSERGRLKRVRRAAGCTVAATVALLVASPGAVARPGEELRPRSLHLGLASIATRGYLLSVETVGHHRVILNVQKGAEVASYVVHGRVSRHRIEADFGRFGRVSLRFHGKPHRFPVAPDSAAKAPRKRQRCRGRHPEREVGHFRGVLEFEGQRGFTRLAVGQAQGEMRRSYRQLCSPVHRRAQAGISSSAMVDPFGFTLVVLSARSRVGHALTRFSAISLESPFGIHLPGSDLFSIVTASLQERVGRVQVFRSTFQVTEPEAVKVSRRGVEPASAQVALESPFDGSAHYKGATKSSPATWAGSLSVRLLGSGAVPLAGPRFRTTLCRASAFSPADPCFRRAEASVAAQGSGSHSQPLAEARLSSFR
jgi:hypothetical protein